jgi:peptidoglycan L-alanyl-D-glutamate endopeptidase CwlK
MLLQIRLEELGFDTKGADGEFGAGTRAAICAYQQSRGLEVDGMAGELTLAALGVGSDPEPEIPSGFLGAGVTTVWKMFSRLAPLKNVREHLPDVLDALKISRLDDRPMVLMALASIRAETEAFRPVSELPSRYNTNAGARPFDKYDWRTDLGNQGPPDGERFKGRGFIQLTGRFNYERFGQEIGEDLVNEPDLANSSSTAAKLLACFIRSRESGIREALEGGDLARARRLVNGGSHGLERFSEAYRAGELFFPPDFRLERIPADEAATRAAGASASAIPRPSPE